jgi:S1-C subfamily serine protease
LNQAFVAVVARIRPQVVEISTNSGLGSGVIYDDRGDIVTNAHVVGSARPG